MSVRAIWNRGWLAKIGIVFGAIYIMYVLLGAFLLPILAEKIVEGQVSESMNRSILVEDIDFNPFTLTATVEGLSVEDDLGGTLFEAGKILVNAQISTAFTERVALRAFHLGDARVSVIMLEDGKLNFDSLMNASPKTEAQPEAGEPVQFWIGTIDVANLSLDFEDRNHATAVKERIGPISFTADNVHNEAEAESPYSFDAAIGESTTFSWSGSLSLNPLASTGSYKIEGLNLSKGKPYWVDMIAIDLKGSLGLSRAFWGL